MIQYKRIKRNNKFIRYSLKDKNDLPLVFRQYFMQRKRFTLFECQIQMMFQQINQCHNLEIIKQNKLRNLMLSDCFSSLFQKCSGSLINLKSDIESISTLKPPNFSPNFKRSNPLIHNKMSTEPSSKQKPKFFLGYSPQRQKSLVIQIRTAQKRKKELLDELKEVDNSLKTLIKDKEKCQEMLSKSKDTIQYHLTYEEKTAKALELVKRMNKQRKEMSRRRVYEEQKILRGIEKSYEYTKQIMKADEIKKEEKRKQIKEKIKERRSIHLKSTIVHPKKSMGFITEGASPRHHNNQINTIETRRYERLSKLITDHKQLRKLTEGPSRSINYYHKYEKIGANKGKQRLQNPEEIAHYSSVKLYN